MQDRFRFRAAIKEDKYSKIEFAYSDYDDDYNEERLVGDLRLSLEGNKCYIYRWDWIEYEDSDELEWVDLYGAEIISLEQCTGLKDKNGKLIFEGDILTDGANTFIVNWYDDMALFRLLYKNDNRETYCLFYPDDAASKYTVIGNIHEETEK